MSGDKDKNNRLLSLHIDEDKLLQKHKTIWTTIELLLNIKLNALLVYDDDDDIYIYIYIYIYICIYIYIYIYVYI